MTSLAFALAQLPDIPTYENGRLVSYEDWHSGLLPDFTYADHHTESSAILGDPFYILADKEAAQGGPLALTFDQYAA